MTGAVILSSIPRRGGASRGGMRAMRGHQNPVPPPPNNSNQPPTPPMCHKHRCQYTEQSQTRGWDCTRAVWQLHWHIITVTPLGTNPAEDTVCLCLVVTCKQTWQTEQVITDGFTKGSAAHVSLNSVRLLWRGLFLNVSKILIQLTRFLERGWKIALPNTGVTILANCRLQFWNKDNTNGETKINRVAQRDTVCRLSNTEWTRHGMRPMFNLKIWLTVTKLQYFDQYKLLLQIYWQILSYCRYIGIGVHVSQ